MTLSDREKTAAEYSLGTLRGKRRARLQNALDLDPALNSVSVAASPSTHHGYRAGVCQECSREPIHSLDGMDVSCAMPIVDYPVILDQYCAGQQADRQARCQLGVIRRFLQPGRPDPSQPKTRAGCSA